MLSIYLSEENNISVIGQRLTYPTLKSYEEQLRGKVRFYGPGGPCYMHNFALLATHNPQPATLLFPLFPSIPSLMQLVQQPVIQQVHGAVYRKHADLNRYYIQTAQGKLHLTAAVASPTWQVPYGDIRLSYSENWPEKHLKTLRSAYRASPYFEHYEDEICSLLLAKHDFLHQLSAAALTFCLKTTGYLHPIEIIGKEGPAGFENKDFSHILTAESGASPDILPFPEYRSVFGAEFDASVSILDSLFCVGPHRLHAYLRRYKG